MQETNTGQLGVAVKRHLRMRDGNKDHNKHNNICELKTKTCSAIPYTHQVA